MTNWIIKDIKFGYRYTTNKNTRKIILDYFNDYLFNLISSKGGKDDKFIIVGGLFSNTNPSIVAITDAYNSLSKLSKVIDIVLITSEKDIRLFDGESYSTLNLFKNIHNVEVILDKNFINYNNFTIDVSNYMIKIDEKDLLIPNAIQFEKDDSLSGIFVNRMDGKYTILKNNYSPKHRIININSLSDFDNIEVNNNFIHLIINNELLEVNKSLIDMNIFKIKPISIIYTDKEKDKDIENDEIFDINNNFNIIDVINNDIENDEKLKKQFERILKIYRNN